MKDVVPLLGFILSQFSFSQSRLVGFVTEQNFRKKNVAINVAEANELTSK